MTRYRLLAAAAAVLVALAGVVSVTAGGTPAVPPPVTMRGPASGSTPEVGEGLELVPATVVELDPATAPEVTDRDSVDRDSPDEPLTVDSPDPAPDTAQSAPDDTASVDSPDAPEAGSVDSPDSPDSADSPDD